LERKSACRALASALVLFVLFPLCARGSEPAREEGEFEIRIDGEEVGREKYSIEVRPDGVVSVSTGTLRNVVMGEERVKVETRLEMDPHYMPRSYRVTTSAGERKGMLEGTFSPGQADFRYLLEGTPRKSGLLLDEYYTVLDANVFHHFAFVGRLFDFDDGGAQALDVVIPQELDNGTVVIRDAGREPTEIRGREKRLRHLKLDSGRLLIDLWLDDGRVLQKIGLPQRRIEVVRRP
ncbi:MAG: hypothetical protein JXP48_00500, partial [Acidobacteria bacterium]|nr:hypothetical protein [Acidobacteriota bacterium]